MTSERSSKSQTANALRESSTEHIVVLSDIHANARALEAAFAKARRGPMDRIVILGDLLTYGCDGDRVLDLVVDAQTRHGAELILGNHDQLYFDLRSGLHDYYDSLPDWLRESIDFTMQSIDISRLELSLRWSRDFADGDILFAHANPFEYGDWSYLNSERDHIGAAHRVEARGYRFGVFGHTHRAKIFQQTADGTSSWADAPYTVDRSMTNPTSFVVNPGSIGQPRDASRRSTLLRISRSRGSTTFAIEPVEYDVEAHIRDTQASAMSARTRDRLCSFFLGEMPRG